jgi:hypothetical protein
MCHTSTSRRQRHPQTAGRSLRSYSISMRAPASLLMAEQRLRLESALGPLLGAMQHAKDLHASSSYPVGEYVGCSRDDKLTGIRYTTRTPGGGVITEDFYSVADPLRDVGCCGRFIACDIRSYGFEVFDGLVEPPDYHNGGLRSLRVPQLASQASTSSWLTKRASRLFALSTASRIALVCHSLTATYVFTASASSQALERSVA